MICAYSITGKWQTHTKFCFEDPERKYHSGKTGIVDPKYMWTKGVKSLHTGRIGISGGPELHTTWGIFWPVEWLYSSPKISFNYDFEWTIVVFGLLTRLPAGCQSMEGTRDLYHLRNVQVLCESHPASYSLRKSKGKIRPRTGHERPQEE